MRFFGQCLGVCSIAAAAMLCAARPAAADTYALYTLSAANGNTDRAIYDDGTTMVYSASCAATSWNPCYKTYDHGGLASLSATQPATAWDNGTACTFSVAGLQTSGICNGNYHAFSFSASNPLAQLMSPGVYAGALDDLGLIYSTAFSSISNLLLNSHGDIAFADTQREELYQAYNTTPTPEPGTLLLLATGLGLGAIVQRKVLG